MESKTSSTSDFFSRKLLLDKVPLVARQPPETFAPRFISNDKTKEKQVGGLLLPWEHIFKSVYKGKREIFFPSTFLGMPFKAKLRQRGIVVVGVSMQKEWRGTVCIGRGELVVGDV